MEAKLCHAATRVGALTLAAITLTSCAALSAATTQQAAPTGSAATQLAALPTKGRAPKTGYMRDRFGPAWKDIDHNGCDTRNDILARDLQAPKYSGRCRIMRGQLTDPYTGRVIAFERGQATSSAVQIDHVVALSNAWQTGAQSLTQAQREQLANDPLNLQATDGPTNSAKGDSDAATWLPPNKPHRCAYIARQVAVKMRYHLWVTAPERAAMQRILVTCKE